MNFCLDLTLVNIQSLNTQIEFLTFLLDGEDFRPR